MGKLYSLDCSGMEVHEFNFRCLSSICALSTLTIFEESLNVPDEYFLFWVFTSRNKIPGVGRKTSFEYLASV